MLVKFCHTNGIYLEKTDSVLCEVYGIPELETHKELFETGWLPTIDGKWYQAKSSRIPIRLETRGKLIVDAGIHISSNGDWKSILEDSTPHYPYLNTQHIQYCIQSSDIILYFNSIAFACLSIYSGVPYISTVIGTRRNKDLLKYVVPMMLEACSTIEYRKPYSILDENLYIGEWYNSFGYKQNYDGFEWWDGEKWIM